MEPVDPWATIRGLPENVQAVVVSQMIRDIAKKDFEGKFVPILKKINIFVIQTLSIFVAGAGIVGLTWCITALLISMRDMF